MLNTTISFKTYEKEINNFLLSCTIKNNWIINSINNILISKKIKVDINNPASWKYYVNLSGSYHESDEQIFITSFDTKEKILFDKNTLTVHARTREYYTPGNIGYVELSEQYPNHVDFIKSVIYPVSNIDDAIAADNFTLLSYGPNILESDEEQSIVFMIKQFIKYVTCRWYFLWLSHETFYEAVFWGNLWQHLVGAIHSFRIKNIHTAKVHSFHVWEHLTSLGIGNYSDVLTRRQSMFLYRNMRYVLSNRGKSDNLILLVNKLLTEQSVNMVAKTLKQQTLDKESSCEWVPEFVSKAIETQFSSAVLQQPPETVGEITYKLNKLGVEPDSLLKDIAKNTLNLAATTSSSLPTKLLEIQPALKDTKYAVLLNNFILDNLIRSIQYNKYVGTVHVTDELTGSTLNLSSKNTLILLYYVTIKSYGKDIPNIIPNIYTPLIGTFKDLLDITPPLPTKIKYGKYEYSVSSYVDTSVFIREATPKSKYLTGDELSSDIIKMFNVLVSQLLTVRYTADDIATAVIEKLTDLCLDNDAYELTLSKHTTYATWLSAPNLVDVVKLMGAYDKVNNSEKLYSKLASNIIFSLIPPSKELIGKYSNITNEDFYRRIKQLFIQLCSYTVLFLDSESHDQSWEFLATPKIKHEASIHISSANLSGEVAVTSGSSRISTLTPVKVNDVKITKSSSKLQTTSKINNNLNIVSKHENCTYINNSKSFLNIKTTHNNANISLKVDGSLNISINLK